MKPGGGQDGQVVALELGGRDRLPVGAHRVDADVYDLGRPCPRAVMEDVVLRRVGREITLADPILAGSVGPRHSHREPLAVEMLAVVAVRHRAAAPALRPEVVVLDALDHVGA